jgi:transposase
LHDAYRCGRPAQVPLEVHCELIKLACQRPADSKLPFRNVWTLNSLRDALSETTAWELSRSEIWRILKSKGLRPHRVRMWLHSPDPEFSKKAARICKLYRSPPNSATVVCIDEKTGMQALERKYPLHSSNNASIQRLEYEYIRHGTRSLIAALEPATGKVFGYCGPTRKAQDLEVFMNALAKRYPRGDVYVIWDNLNIHKGGRWDEFNSQNGSRFHFVHTPIHASWMNQIESWFSILQRRILKYGDFASADELAASVLQFISYWNKNESHAFHWKWRGPGKDSTRRKAA